MFSCRRFSRFRRKQFLSLVESLFFPSDNHLRMNARQGRQLVDRLLTLLCRQGHLSLDRGRISLPLRCHDHPFLEQPIVTESTVQFLVSNSVKKRFGRADACVDSEAGFRPVRQHGDEGARRCSTATSKRYSSRRLRTKWIRGHGLLDDTIYKTLQARRSVCVLAKFREKICLRNI